MRDPVNNFNLIFWIPAGVYTRESGCRNDKKVYNNKNKKLK